MNFAVKAAVVGAVSATAALLIKKSNPELAFLLAAAVIACIAAAAVRLLTEVAGVIGEAESFSGMSAAVFSPVVKCVGIGITAKISADLCRDAAQSGIASAVELVGSVAAVYAALPLISTLMKMIGDMI